MGVGTRLAASFVIAASSLSVAAPATAGTTGTTSGSGSPAPATAGTTGTTSSAGTGSTLHWRPCSLAFLCASLTVPLNYANPHQGTLKLALVELPATGVHPVGDLVMNPGGPGASGVQFLEQTSFPVALRASFNLVSFDPRGVGESDPVTCVGAAGIRSLVALDPDPTTPREIADVVRATQSFDRACAEHTPSTLLHNVSTMDTVRDLDRIRAALGQAKLNYLGFSYGTYLGELYAKTYPSHVRAMVLDGAVDPALSDDAVAAQQAEGFERDLGDFFAWCKTDQSCAQELPGGAKSSYEQVMGPLAQGHSLLADLQPQYGGQQQVTLGVAEVAVLGSLYSEETWPDLAQALSEALAGNGGLLAALAYSYEGLQPNGQYTNLVAANAAISCTDRRYPSDVGAYEQLAGQL
ncbi:MAG: alpha/beta fold hydrolase, partial [Acidimicrobiales bacterium]